MVQKRVQVLLAVFQSSRTSCMNQEMVIPGVGFVHDEKKEWLPVCVNVHPNLRPCDSDVTIQASQ